jgi:hypothetical protein
VLSAALEAQDDGMIHDQDSALAWLDEYEAIHGDVSRFLS